MAGCVAGVIINLSHVLVLIGIAGCRRFLRQHAYKPLRFKCYKRLPGVEKFEFKKHVEEAVGHAAWCKRRNVKYTRRVVNLLGYLAQRRHVGNGSKVHLSQRWTRSPQIH